MRRKQPDLFADSTEPAQWKHVASPDFIAGIRRDVTALHDKVRAAETLPWDIMGALNAEREFWGLLNWLPPEEAEPLRASFDAEMDRLLAPFIGEED